MYFTTLNHLLLNKYDLQNISNTNTILETLNYNKNIVFFIFKIFRIGFEINFKCELYQTYFFRIDFKYKKYCIRVVRAKLIFDYNKIISHLKIFISVFISL